jgi:hypothetical protein
MNARIRFGLALPLSVVFSIASASLARAQRSGSAGMRPAAAAAHARPVAAHAVVSHPVVARGTVGAVRVTRFDTATNGFTFNDGSFLPLQDFPNFFPGVGFDSFPFNLNNRDLLIKAAIDPVTQWQFAVAERVLNATRGVAPFTGFWWPGGGSYVLPTEPAPAEQAPQPQPQIIILQQPPAAQTPSATAEPAPAPEAAAPPVDVGQFVLALRNGSQIQAVAFTRVNDHIVYITADGSRRMIAASDLDPGTTTLINEELGTPLQFPL